MTGKRNWCIAGSLETILQAVCAAATIALVYWLQQNVADQGFMAVVAQLTRWIAENLIASALLFVAIVLFGIFGTPYLLAKLEDENSFLSRFGLIVVGSLVVIGVVHFGIIAWNLMATALSDA
ncbi:hypothetical protein [Diaphorobacter sp. LR2014-1]|uniref:hypothetical protein n=1 Tax=Diaphorobacter sp. LR2014-1 TaxID=1933219 RepID=UPI000CDAA520|nr:hypothetical protein [Diaphorobacter sp. LR2014-1]POR07967.1 hypothetical protein BV908_18470 [Diaphorobacter sp. LR2014-1]